MLDKIKWLGHASFRIEGEKTIYIDPWKTGGGPTADIILITHEHYDHCSVDDVEALAGEDTAIVTVSDCARKLGRDVTVIAPGEAVDVKGIRIEAVPAYNLNKSFHPRGAGWVGFVIEVEGTRIYHTGDTDFIPEMKDVKADIMLVPVGGTYTMTASEAAQAVKTVNPKIAVPMHFGDIVGEKRDAETFRKEAGVQVEVLTPQR